MKDREQHFFPQQVEVMRRFQRLTQTEAANRAGVSQAVWSRVESGRLEPDSELLEKFASALHVPMTRFFQEPPSEPPPIIFRATKGTPAAVQHSVPSAVEIATAALARMREHASTDADLLQDPGQMKVGPDNGMSPAEAVAKRVREKLQLGTGPVKNVMFIVELFADVIPCAAWPDSIDAVSAARGPNLWPLVIYRNNQPGDRLRFTLAHELGHLLLHGGDVTVLSDPRRESKVEDEANEFAAELLMPREVVEAEMTGMSWRLSELVELKAKWGLSIAALFRRAKVARVIGDEQYTAMVIRASQLGWRRVEPGQVQREEPIRTKNLIARYEAGCAERGCKPWADLALGGELYGQLFTEAFA